MMRHSESCGPTFMQWANLFPDKIYVMTTILQCFRDESATHDLTGAHLGSTSPTVGGLIAEPAYWNVFRKKWKAILNRYDVKYFHFEEWHHKKPPFNNPKLQGLQHLEFFHDLASLIGEVSIPIGGSSNAAGITKKNPQENTLESALEGFYDNAIVSLNKHWPNFKGKVMFIHEGCGDRTITGILNEVHDKQKDPRIGQLTYSKGSTTEDPLLDIPLEAADFFTTAMRQQTVKIWSSPIRELPKPRTVDFLMSGKSVHFNKTPLLRWRYLVKQIREDERLKHQSWKASGINQKYYPYEHFDFDKYGYTITKV